MRLVAYDPYVSAERARQMGVELLGLDELVAEADFLTIHLPKTPETVGLIGAELLAEGQAGPAHHQRGPGRDHRRGRAGRGHRRGARSAGAAIDVFAEEPTTSSPLFELDSVVVTPHLGASTAEAQDKAGVTIAEQVVLALAGEFVPFAVNVSAAEASETVRPFLPLAERLGRLFAALPTAGAARRARRRVPGSAWPTTTPASSPCRCSRACSAPAPTSRCPTSTPRSWPRSGVEVRETTTTAAHDYVNLVTVRGGDHAIAGTLVGLRGEARIVMVDDHDIDVPPPHMLVVRNDDRPGMIGVGRHRRGRGRRQHRRHARGPLRVGGGRHHGPGHRRARPR